MENFTPWSALLGGSLIGLATAILLLINGRTAGISGIAASAIALSKGEKLWKWVFLLGLIAGCGLAIQFAVEPPKAPQNSTWVLILGGSLVGFGTVLGNGCTSGHGVCGIGRFSKRSIIATLIFMVSAMLTVAVIQ
jgi:uncharacterized membrane protein YedE/YeeE